MPQSPAVNYRVQRWIEECQSKWVEKKFLQSDSRAIDFHSSQADEMRHITNQKHEIYIKRTYSRFNDASKIWRFAGLCILSNPPGLYLSLVSSYSQINFGVNCQCKDETKNPQNGNNKGENIEPQHHHESHRCTKQPHWDHHSNNTLVSHKFAISKMKMNCQEPVNAYSHDADEWRYRKKTHCYVKSHVDAAGHDL